MTSIQRAWKAQYNALSGNMEYLIILLKKGTYILILHLQKDQNLQIGRLGRFKFRAGFYAYAGSAFGSGGLAGRIRHHLIPTTRPYWHIDYLRRVTDLDQIWLTTADTSQEHAWVALLLELPGATIPVKRFGASGCRCESHLVQFLQQPDIQFFRELIRERFPGEASVQTFSLGRSGLWAESG